MKKKDYVILMADIVASRKTQQNKLMKMFRKITNEINYEKKDILLSPITVTLGDEFQCVVKNVESGLELMISIDEKKLYELADFKLRYVLLEGGIDTPINQNIAYGMLGEGLTKARERLTESKNTHNRYLFYLKNIRKSEALMNSMIIYQSIIDDWKTDKDYPLVKKFLELKDYKLVADDLGKTRSQIWKRENSLNLDAYFSIKKVINYITETK